MDDATRDVLLALGDGGTTDMANRMIEFFGGTRLGVRPEDIGDLTIVSAEIRRAKQAICNWVSRDMYSFPRPFLELESTRLWDMRLIRNWAKGNPDLCGEFASVSKLLKSDG